MAHWSPGGKKSWGGNSESKGIGSVGPPGVREEEAVLVWVGALEMILKVLAGWAKGVGSICVVGVGSVSISLASSSSPQRITLMG